MKKIVRGYKSALIARRKRNRLLELVLEQLRPCDRCKTAFNPAFMDWHHRDPEQKTEKISRNLYALLQLSTLQDRDRQMRLLMLKLSPY